MFAWFICREFDDEDGAGGGDEDFEALNCELPPIAGDEFTVERDSDERREEGPGIRVGGGLGCCCREDGRGSMLAVGVVLRNSWAPATVVHSVEGVDTSPTPGKYAYAPPSYASETDWISEPSPSRSVNGCSSRTRALSSIISSSR